MRNLKAFAAEVVRSLGDGPPASRREEQRRQFLNEATAPRGSRVWRVWLPLGAVAAATCVALVVVRLRNDRTEDVPYWVAEAPTPARVGEALVATADAPLPVRFGDGSRVRFSPSSSGLVRQAHGRKVAIQLADGALLADIVPRAQTGVAWTFESGPFVVHVTGTAFELRFQRARKRLELDLHHGQVLVTGPALAEGTALTAGMRLVVEEGADPQVSSLGELVVPAAATAELDAGAEPELPTEAAEAPETPVPVARHGPVSDGEWKGLAARKDYAGALEAARRVGFQRLTRRVALPDLMLLCDVARYAHQPVEAKQALAALEQRFPRSSEVRLVPFLRGRLALEEEHDATRAAAQFRAYLARNPRGALVEEATGRLLQALKLTGDLDAARDTAHTYLERFPNGSYAPLARSVSGATE